MTWRDKPHKTSRGEPNGGGCYNCHQIGPDTTSFGNIGPSLYNFANRITSYNVCYTKLLRATSRMSTCCSTMVS